MEDVQDYFRNPLATGDAVAVIKTAKDAPPRISFGTFSATAINGCIVNLEGEPVRFHFSRSRWRDRDRLLRVALFRERPFRDVRNALLDLTGYPVYPGDQVLFVDHRYSTNGDSFAHGTVVAVSGGKAMVEPPGKKYAPTAHATERLLVIA